MRHEMELETLVEQKVTYSLELEGRFILIENVPARVNVETGERFFAPETMMPQLSGHELLAEVRRID